MESLARDKHPNLHTLFISYVENEILWIHTQGLYPQYFIVFVTYEWPQ
jgi:hypothetical protein